MSFRRLVLVIHRWLGLGSSMVLALVGTTGAYLIASGLPLRRYAGAIHERLALGQAGKWIVIIATASAVALELGGIVLWWRRKLLRVRMGRGWRQVLNDLHHLGGMVCLPIMFVLALSGVFMSFVGPAQQPEFRRLLMSLHTANRFPLPVKVLYVVCSVGFLVQGITGVVMWWTPKKLDWGK